MSGDCIRALQVSCRLLDTSKSISFFVGTEDVRL